MYVTIVKLRYMGDSLILTVPKPVVDKLGWVKGDDILIRIDSDDLTTLKAINLKSVSDIAVT